MVAIKDAVRNASAFAAEALGPERTAGLQLEEVESGLANHEDAWLITLSMLVPSKWDAVLKEPKRAYKVFAVSKSTGEVAWMRMRELTTT